MIALVKNKDNTFLLFFRKYPKAASDPVDIDGGKLEENFSNDKSLFSSDNASSSWIELLVAAATSLIISFILKLVKKIVWLKQISLPNMWSKAKVNEIYKWNLWD